MKLEDKLEAANNVEIQDSKAAPEQVAEKASSGTEENLGEVKDTKAEITDPSSGKKEQGAKPGEQKGEENTKPWFEAEGFKTEEEAIKSYKELRAHATRQAQEKSEIDKKLAAQEAMLLKIQEFFKEPGREEAEDPEITELNEKIANTPAFKAIVNFLGEIEEDRRRAQLSSELSNFKSTHTDYAEYEQAMTDILSGMDEKSQAWLMNHPGGYPAAIDFLYTQAKIKNFTSDLEKKKALAADEKKKIEDANKGSMNLLGEAIDPSLYGVGRVVDTDKQNPFDGSLRYFYD